MVLFESRVAERPARQATRRARAVVVTAAATAALATDGNSDRRSTYTDGDRRRKPIRSPVVPVSVCPAGARSRANTTARRNSSCVRSLAVRMIWDLEVFDQLFSVGPQFVRSFVENKMNFLF